jgi:ferredoxin/coenzyme F420-reducing hydrogenase delta subunit
MSDERIGVILCGCRNPAMPVGSTLAGELRRVDPSLIIRVGNGLCQHPDRLEEYIARERLKEVIVAACHSEEQGPRFTEMGERAGVSPFHLEVVDLAFLSRLSPYDAIATACVLIQAARERLRSLGEIGPENLKPSLPTDGPVSRRDLLFSLVRPRSQVVPSVQAERCVAWKGCARCIKTCPQQAISLEEGRARVEKLKCVSCGACLPVCPVGAIRQPLLRPERLEAELQALLSRNEIVLEPRILLVQAGGTLPRETAFRVPFLPFRLPSIGALSPWLLLRAFSLGADAVVVLPCGEGCRHGCSLERWEQTLGFVRQLLDALGIGGERLQVYSASMEGSTIVNDLEEFFERIRGMGPPRLGQSPVMKGVQEGVAGLIQALAAGNNGVPPLRGEQVPFGVVTLTEGQRTCTLCGACPGRCPTEALTLKEDSAGSRLLFDHGRCIACSACVQVCPEQVLHLDRALDFSRLTSPTLLAEDRMVRCKECGETIGPARMVDKVLGTVSRGASAPYLKTLAELCPSCRIFGAVGVR